MELRQLRDFLALAEELHYARAAARRGIEQSPLSRRIKDFEQGLGVLLFARTSRGTQLTPRGEFLLPWARAIISAADQVRALLRAPSVPQDAVSVSIGEDVPSEHLLPLLAKFQLLHPEIALTHVERSELQVFDEMRVGLVDVSFSLFVNATSDLAIDPLRTTRACAVLPQAHPLSGNAELGEDELGHQPIGLARADARGLLQQRLGTLARLLSPERQAQEAENLRILLRLVYSGKCIGIVGPAQAEMIQAIDFAVRPIAHPGALFTIHMVHRPAGPKGTTRLLEALAQQSQKVDPRCSTATARDS